MGRTKHNVNDNDNVSNKSSNNDNDIVRFGDRNA